MLAKVLILIFNYLEKLTAHFQFFNASTLYIISNQHLFVLFVGKHHCNLKYVILLLRLCNHKAWNVHGQNIFCHLVCMFLVPAVTITMYMTFSHKFESKVMKICVFLSLKTVFCNPFMSCKAPTVWCFGQKRKKHAKSVSRQGAICYYITVTFIYNFICHLARHIVHVWTFSTHLINLT